MTGHDIVKQLREMEQRVEPVPWIFDLEGVYVHDPYTGDIIDIPNGGDDAEFIAKTRNNTDLLLSIAESFRPGDAARLALLEHYVDKHMVGCQYDDEDNAEWLQICYAISRLQAAAERLECKP